MVPRNIFVQCKQWKLLIPHLEFDFALRNQTLANCADSTIFRRHCLFKMVQKIKKKWLVLVRLFHLLLSHLEILLSKYCFSYLKIRLDYLTSTANLPSLAYCEQHTRIIAGIYNFKVSNKQLYLCLMPTELTAATKNPQSCNTVLFPTKALAFLSNRNIFIPPPALINVSCISEILRSLQNIPFSKWRHCKKRIR